jgi:perosamine synthetase
MISKDKELSRTSKDSFSKSGVKVPFFVPQITDDDVKSVVNALKSPLLTDGPKLREFELAFSKFTGAKYAIGVSNATSALHLSLKAIGLKKGDEVIIPDQTFVATANAVLLSGATPVIADVEENGMNISTDSIEENITKKTRLILPVHIAGKACDMNSLKKIARKHDVSILEDCAHAIGAKYEDKHVGTFGLAGCFSFYPTKNITTIEGGMVITNSKQIADYVRITRNHGLTRTLSQRFTSGKPWDYDVVEPGYNYRLDEVRSSLGLSQLKRIKKLNNLRKKAFEYYNERLGKIEGIVTPEVSKKDDNVYHLYIVRIQKKYGIERDALFKKLLKLGIRTSLHYKPLHEFTSLKKLAKSYGSLKNTTSLYREILSLPLYPEITKKEQDYVVECIAQK